MQSKMNSSRRGTARKAAGAAPAALAAAALLAAPLVGAEDAAAQAAGGAAVAAQEAGAIFTDDRIRRLAERRLRQEEIRERIAEIQLIQQLETVDPVAAEQYRIDVLGEAPKPGGDEFFEAYDQAQIDRGVVLPTVLSVRGSGGELVAEIDYEGNRTFVRSGQVLDDYVRVTAVETRSVVVEIRGRKFRVPLTSGG
jgi:type IV pilus biogenesis protein PilP